MDSQDEETDSSLSIVASPNYKKSLDLLSGIAGSRERGFSIDSTVSEQRLLEEGTQFLLHEQESLLKRPTTSSKAQAVLNTTNVLVGIGILAYPFALKCTGWIGVLFILFVIMVTRYTAILLGKCMDLYPNVRSFPELGRQAFGKKMEIFIGVIFFLELFLACASYIILQADNLIKIYPEVMGKTEWIILVTLVVLPTTWTADFSWLSYLSIFGIIASVFLLVVVLVNGFITFLSPGSILHPAETQVFDLNSFPLAFGIVMSGFGGHAVLPNIYESMHKPQEFGRVVNISYWTTGFIYLVMATAGYLMYGEGVLQEITLNLPTGSLSVLATWMTIINPATKFAITLFPITVNIESIILAFAKTRQAELNHWTRVLIRTLCIGAILLLAIYLPFFDRILEFTGSLCSFTVSLTFPCLCVLKLLWTTLPPYERYLNISLVVLGIFFSLIGSFVAIYGPLNF